MSRSPAKHFPGRLSALSAAALLLCLNAVRLCAAPPVILFQPVEQRAMAGGRTELGVSAQCAAGENCPLTYQWLRDGQPVTGGTSRLLLFNPARTQDAGTYQVIVRGSSGETWSRAVQLHITGEPPAPGTVDLAFAAAKIENPSGSVRGTVYAIAPAAGGGMLIGGDFTLVDGMARPGLAKLTASGAIDTTFTLSALPTLVTIRCLAPVPGGWIAGGSGYTVRKPWLGFIPADGGAVRNLESGFTFTATPGQEVRALLPLPDGRVIAGGTFSVTAAGYGASRLIRLKSDLTLDTTLPAAGWNAGVQALALTPAGEIIAGGAFSAPRRCLVRLRPDGSPDAAFNPPAAGWSGAAEVTALIVQASGRIIAGGKFSFAPAGLVTRHSIAAFQHTGGFDDSFRALPNTDSKAEVRALLTDGPERIIMAGRFTDFYNTSIAGTVRVPWSGVAMLNNSGGLIQPQSPAAWDDRTVFSLALTSSRRLLAGGDFAWPAARLTGIRMDEHAVFAPIIHRSIVPQAIALRAGDPLRLSVAATAWPAAQFQWFRNGQALDGATSAELYVPASAPLHAGTYTVRVSNVAGTITSSPASVAVHVAPPGFAPLVAAASTNPLVIEEFTTNYSAQRVTVPFTPVRIAVSLRLWHRDTNDLSATLISPGGQRAQLFKRPDPTGRNFEDTSFDDTSTLLLTDSLPPFRGNYQTGGTLNALRSFATAGDWLLEIENAGGQKATLDSWSLVLEGPAAPVTYAAWRDAVLSGAQKTAPGEDADGDGVSNAGEFLFGPVICEPYTAPGGIHQVGVTPAGTRLLTWCGWEDASYRLECSPDLLHWQTAVEGVDCTTLWTARTEPARLERTLRLGEAPANRFWRLRGE